MSRTEYVWSEPGLTTSVHLPREVVTRLALDALEAYKAIPKRGLEIGGLLLGEREGSAIYISGFQPVESEHRWGPAYRLSENDLQAFDEALQQHSNALGIYRTSTLAKPLALDEEDVKLFRHSFQGDGNVYLLLQPANGTAGFFVAEGETLAGGHAFPFRTFESPGEPADYEPPPAAIAAEAAVATVPAPPPPSRPPTSRRAQWIQAGALLFGMVAGAAIYHGFHRTPQPVKAAPPVPTPPALAAGKPSPLNDPMTQARVPLGVQRDGPAIMLFWDPHTSVVQSANKAMLYIFDGPRQQQNSLDRDDLHSGVFAYHPRSSDLTFQLKIFDSAGIATTDDSIRVVGNLPDRHPPSSTKPPIQTAETNPVPEQPTKGTASRTDTRPEPPPSEPQDPRPSPFTPVPKPVMTAPPPTEAHPPTPLTVPKSSLPDVAVRVEPDTGTKIGHMVGHIPVLRRLRKQPAGFVPPLALRQVNPAITARQRHGLTEDVPIDVKVMVGKSGKVEDAEVLSRTDHQPLLADLALSAARRWEFAPAHVGSDKMAGAVILHFTFLMDQPPPAPR